MRYGVGGGGSPFSKVSGFTRLNTLGNKENNMSKEYEDKIDQLETIVQNLKTQITDKDQEIYVLKKQL